MLVRARLLLRPTQLFRPFSTSTEEPPKTPNTEQTPPKEQFKSSRSQHTRPYKKPDFLADEYDHLSMPASAGVFGAQIEDNDFLPDYMMKDAPNVKRNEIRINLPWLINGAPFNQVMYRYLPSQVYSRMKIHEGEVLEHLFKIYRAVLLSIQDRDFEFLEQYCEEMFFTKIRNRLNQIKADGFTLSIEEDLFADKGKPIKVEANMYDSVLIKGLSTIRRENGAEDDYFVSNEIEHIGLMSYIPKYITQQQNFSDPIRNKEIHSEAHKVTYRAYVTFKSGYKLYMKDKYGTNQFEYPSDYTWQHVGVFETQMQPPPQFKEWGGSESLMEWIAKHTFTTWRMVDLDNWLVGNPLVIPKYDVRMKTGSDKSATDLFTQAMNKSKGFKQKQ